MKKPNLIYPCRFEVLDPTKSREQEKGIDKAIAEGYMPIYIFNDNSDNVKNLIPTKFKKNIEKHPLYKIWIELLLRCYHKQNPEYKNIGAKGIELNKEWVNSFEQYCKDIKITPINI